MNQPEKKNHQYSTCILLPMQRMLDFYLVNSFRPCDADKTHLSIIILGWRERESLITITTTSQHFLFEDCSTSAVPAHKREKQFLTPPHTHILQSSCGNSFPHLDRVILYTSAVGSDVSQLYLTGIMEEQLLKSLFCFTG